jgi:hypothetical protein
MGQKGKVLSGVIVAGIVLLLFIYFFTPKPYTPPISPASLDIGTVDVWREFRSPSERFVVSFPTPPQRAMDSVPMPSSDERIRYDMLLSQAKNGTICMVTIIDYPPSVDIANPDAVLTTAIQEMVAGNPANHLLKTEKGKWLGFPKTDFVIGSKDAVIDGRAILKGSSLFMISVAAHDPQTADAAFKKLSDSFVLTE